MSKDNGGRVALLFLLFLLALYQFYSSGFSAFAVVCLIPVIVLVMVATFRYGMFLFWSLIIVNYFVQLKDVHMPIPTSVPNEIIEMLALMAFAIIDVKNNHFERAANAMMVALAVWCGFCTLEVMNDTCNVGIDVGAWYTVARMIGYQLLYIFLVFSLYLTTPKLLMRYLVLWGCLALFASFWVWKQKTFGFTTAETVDCRTRGRTTHILQGGTLIRYFSIYSDAANFGIGMAATAVPLSSFGITSKIKQDTVVLPHSRHCCAWGMFPSGTRTAIFCSDGRLHGLCLPVKVQSRLPFPSPSFSASSSLCCLHQHW